jgi:hypothetical protein
VSTRSTLPHLLRASIELVRRDQTPDPGSLLLAMVPGTFPTRMLGFYAFPAAACGFATADSVRGRAVVIPGKCPHYCAQDSPAPRRQSAPMLPQMDLSAFDASLGRVFSSPAAGTRWEVFLTGRGCSPSPEFLPLCTFPLQRRAAAQSPLRKQKDSPRRHGGTVLVAGVAIVPTDEQGQAPERPRSASAASPQAESLRVGDVAMAFSPDRSSKRSFCRCVVSRAIS